MRRLTFLFLLALPFLAPASSHALSVSNGIFSYELLPGASASDTFTVTNTDSVSQSYRIVLQDFTATDESGSPTFIPENSPRLASSLAGWTSWSADKIVLAPGESRVVSFKITVPENAVTGGYYGALLLSHTQAGATGGNIDARTGPLLVVVVDQDKTAALSLLEFSSGTNFYTHLPASFFARVKNEGLTPAAPQAKVTITNLLAGTSAVLNLNPNGGYVLPAQTRRFEAVWQQAEVPAESLELVKEWKNFGFGYYHAWLTMTEANGKVLSAQKSFWVIPWELITFVLLILCALIFFTRRLKNTKRAHLIILAAFFFLYFPHSVSAAALTSVSDQMVSQTLSAASNHAIGFVTPTGVSEGSTVTLTFASSFTTSPIIEDDVDVLVGSVQRTTASTCAGSEQISVAMVSSVLTITVCAGDGGAIPAGSTVTVNIGINATSSGTGSNRIVNPATAGTYSISIAGTFGDFGSIGEPIVTTSSGSLTAVVPGGSGSGGGGSGGTTLPSTPTGPSSSSDSSSTPAETGTTESKPTTGTTAPTTSETSTPTTTETPTKSGTETTGGTAPTTGGTTSSTGSTGGATGATGASTTGGTTSTGGTPPEQIVAESGTGLSETAIEFLVEGGDIVLPEQDGTVSVLPDHVLTLLVAQSAFEKDVATISVTVDGSTYTFLKTDAGNYETALSTPGASGNYQAVVNLIYADGTTQTISTMLNVVDFGYVYENVGGHLARVSGATVMLLQSQFGKWVEVKSSTTDTSGTFGWYVENGIYRVRASKEGYQESLGAAFATNNHLATGTVLMEKLPEPVAQIVASNRTPLQKAAAIVGSLYKQAANVLQDIRADDQVQIAADVAAPILVTLTVTSSVILWNVFNLAPLLQYVMSSPLLLVGRKKRKGWGVVYNAATKLPVDLAIVRLVNAENRLVATRVTDAQGRYFFLAQPGSYRLSVVKPSFVFPSHMLGQIKEDVGFLDVYHGEPITVTEKDATIAANIPLDPNHEVSMVEPRRISRLRLLGHLQRTFSLVGLAAALFILIIQPSTLTLIGLLVQVTLYALFHRLARTRKPKSWGIVYDEKTHHPLANAIVRIFEPKYNKLLETMITDRHGRYSFLVGPNEYFVTYDRDTYHPVEVRPVDLRSEKNPKEVAIDVGMERTKI